MQNVDTYFTANSKKEALEKLSVLVCKDRDFLDPAKVFVVLQEREELGSTGIGNESAIPHGKMDIGSKIAGAIAISKKGIEFDAIDNRPVKIFITLIAGKNATSVHLKILAKISKLLMDEQFRNKLISADTAKEIFEILKENNR
jgi:PTS system nitrogen regulatory IIA component